MEYAIAKCDGLMRAEVCKADTGFDAMRVVVS